MKLSSVPFLTLALLASACTGISETTKKPDMPRAGWTSQYEQNHAFAGRWYDVREGRFTSPASVRVAAAEADILFLGEKHDNPDHHEMQAQFVAAGAAGSKLLMEMLVLAQADVAAKLEKGMSADAMSSLLDWDKNWSPAIDMYAPVLTAALNREMSVYPANASRTRVRATITQGLDGEDPAFVRRWQLDKPLSNGRQAALEQEIRDVHCGHLPEEYVRAMAGAQRLRDAAMAQSVVNLAGQGQRIVIAGNGHVRNDRGIPALLKERVSDSVLSIAFVEVREDFLDATKYASFWGIESLPFDYILFTPVVDPADPCEKFRHQFSKKPG